MIKSASHATKNLLELFYTQSSIAYALSGLKYHDLKKKKKVENPGKNKNKYFEIK